MVAVAYECFSLQTKLKTQFKRGFTKVVGTRAGGFREWSRGHLYVVLLAFSDFKVDKVLYQSEFVEKQKQANKANEGM